MDGNHDRASPGGLVCTMLLKRTERRQRNVLTIGRPTTAIRAAPLCACIRAGQSFSIAEALRFGASIGVVFVATAAVRNFAPRYRKARRVGREPACLSERASGVAGL